MRRALLMCVAVSACGGASAGTPTSPSAATLQSIAIVGMTSTLGVGETVQLSVRGSYSDGTTQTISSGILWTTRSLTCTVDTAGLLSGRAEGTCTVDAVASGMSAAQSGTVTPATAFTASGYVLQKWGAQSPHVPAASVVVVDGPQAGRRVAADQFGAFSISGLPLGPVRLRGEGPDFDSSTVDAAPGSSRVNLLLEPKTEQLAGTFVGNAAGAGSPQLIPVQVRYAGYATIRLRTSFHDCGSGDAAFFIVSLVDGASDRWVLSQDSCGFPRFGVWHEARTLIPPGSYVLRIFRTPTSTDKIREFEFVHPR